MANPIWDFFTGGMPVTWTVHNDNPRFEILSTTGVPENDCVLDQETGLVWPRNAFSMQQTLDWMTANRVCRTFNLNFRNGWRLPSVEELSSLVDTGMVNYALPYGHPFLNVQAGSGIPAYWTCTNEENPSSTAYIVNLWRSSNGGDLVGVTDKSCLCNVWPVRGGTAGVNWNW